MISEFRNGKTRKKCHMKTNNQKKDNGTTDNETTDNKKTEQRSEVGGQGSEVGTEAPDQWWDRLTAAERQFAYDLNDIVRGLKESGFAEITTGVEKVKDKLRAAFQRLGVAYHSAGVQSPGGGPDRWRWN